MYYRNSDDTKFLVADGHKLIIKKTCARLTINNPRSDPYFRRPFSFVCFGSTPSEE